MLVGPPAVGKMTVGQALAERTGLRLFHNHKTIDLVLPLFPFGSPPYQRLVKEFRRRIFEEVAASDMPGLIFTFVWAFDDTRDAAAVEQWSEIFRARRGRVVFVELEATQAFRLRRNETEFRLAEKPFMRDPEVSRARLLSFDEKYQLNSGGMCDARPDWLRLEITDMEPAEAAERIVTRFDLPRPSEPPSAI
jgi:hypothetical protein